MGYKLRACLTPASNTADNWFPDIPFYYFPSFQGKGLLRADSAGNVLRIRKQWVLDEIEEPVCQGLKLSAATLQTEGILVTYSTK